MDFSPPMARGCLTLNDAAFMKEALTGFRSKVSAYRNREK